MNTDHVLEAARVVLAADAEDRQALEGTTTRGEANENAFDPEEAASGLDELTANAFLNNHAAKKMLDADKRAKIKETSFKVRIATPQQLRSCGHSVKAPVTFDVNVHEAINRLLNVAECPKSAFVSEIKVISASQSNDEGRTMYLEFGAGGECNSSTMVEATPRGAGREAASPLNSSTLIAVPDKQHLQSVGVVYDASAFARSSTFIKYHEIAESNPWEFSGMVPGTLCASYVSPYSITPAERAKAVDLGHTTNAVDRLNGEPTVGDLLTSEGKPIKADAIISLMFHNIKAFSTPPVATLKQGLNGGEDQVLSVEMQAQDYQALQNTVATEVLTPLRKHMMSLDDKKPAHLSFTLSSDPMSVKTPEGARRKTLFANNNSVDILLDVTMSYV